MRFRHARTLLLSDRHKPRKIEKRSNASMLNDDKSCLAPATQLAPTEVLQTNKASPGHRLQVASLHLAQDLRLRIEAEVVEGDVATTTLASTHKVGRSSRNNQSSTILATNRGQTRAISSVGRVHLT